MSFERTVTICKEDQLTKHEFPRSHMLVVGFKSFARECNIWSS